MLRNLATLTICTLMILFVISGCGKRDVETSDKASEQTSDTLQAAVDSSGGILPLSFKDRKREYIASVIDTYNSWIEKVNDIKFEKETFSKEAQAPLEKPLIVLLGSRDIMKENMTRLENSNQEDFENAKKEFEVSVNYVSDAYNKLAALF